MINKIIVEVKLQEKWRMHVRENSPTWPEIKVLRKNDSEITITALVRKYDDDKKEWFLVHVMHEWLLESDEKMNFYISQFHKACYTVLILHKRFQDYDLADKRQVSEQERLYNENIIPTLKTKK